MGKFAKIAMGLNVVAIIAVLVALIVDTLSVVDESSGGVSYEGTYGATEGEIEFSYGGFSSKSTTEWGECCDDDDDDDCCDVSGRGVAWIIFNVIAMILGIIAAVADFGIAAVSFNGISNKFLPIIAGVCVLLAILIWEIDNPAYDNDFFDATSGASIFIAAVGLVFFIIAGALEFAPGGGDA